jgi:hypothetical protein
MQFKIEEIGQASTEVRDWIKSQNTMPVLITVARQQINRAKYLYLLAKATVQAATHNNAPVEVSPNIENPDTKSIDTITTAKLYKEPRPGQGYISLAWKLLQYIDTNQRAPAYGLTEHGKLGFGNMIETYSRILAYHHEKGNLPLYANIKHILYPDATTPTPAPEHEDGVYLTPQFRHNIKQETKYWCGPFMTSQIIYELFGHEEAQSVLAGWEGTTEDGTGHQGINDAIYTFNRTHGTNLTIEWRNFTDTGWERVGEMMEDPNIGLGIHGLYRLRWGHYMFPVYLNTNQNSIGIIDSLNEDNDILYVSIDEMRSWIANNYGGQPSLCIVTK